MNAEGGRGRFIVLEGIDASGKSTQASKLARWLEGLGHSVHLTAEPSTGPVGALIRQAFSGRIPLDDRVIAALFIADRLDHLTNQRDGILSLLDQGIDVVSDRYYLSSLAYHSGDTSMDWVLKANSVSTDLLKPDVTVYLDLDPAEAFKRLQERREKADKFEVLERLETAHAAYADGISRISGDETVIRVSAIGEPQEVFTSVVLGIEGVLGLGTRAGAP